jgi:hypothetical protein
MATLATERSAGKQRPLDDSSAGAYSLSAAQCSVDGRTAAYISRGHL